ncbi:hypothetical protein EVAR_17757_1 [Eumeta japonica]|uniref:Uncharacterized protein n=1 Tax=Eumeta variegata TaxID=151549 RepID=A0A4C1TTC6_EUMVA|nr:hypothetical protein EVAR_17757_1 [Eumeta japonica]
MTAIFKGGDGYRITWDSCLLIIILILTPPHWLIRQRSFPRRSGIDLAPQTYSVVRGAPEGAPVYHGKIPSHPPPLLRLVSSTAMDLETPTEA